MKGEPPLNLESVGIPVVRSAIAALNGRERARWFALFADSPRFSDDGTPRDFVKWCDEELFGPAVAYVISIDRVEGGGLTFYARYHSDKWGDFQTLWKFEVKDGKIAGLDVGATSYGP